MQRCEQVRSARIVIVLFLKTKDMKQKDNSTNLNSFFSFVSDISLLSLENRTNLIRAISRLNIIIKRTNKLSVFMRFRKDCCNNSVYWKRSNKINEKSPRFNISFCNFFAIKYFNSLLIIKTRSKTNNDIQTKQNINNYIEVSISYIWIIWILKSRFKWYSKCVVNNQNNNHNIPV